MSGEPLCIHLPGLGVGRGDALHVLHHPLHHGHVQAVCMSPTAELLEEGMEFLIQWQLYQKIRIQKESNKLVPINFQLHFLIFYLFSVFSLYLIVVLKLKTNNMPSWLRAEALANIFWPKGSFHFKIVRWIGALGTPHTLIALRSVIALYIIYSNILHLILWWNIWILVKIGLFIILLNLLFFRIVYLSLLRLFCISYIHTLRRFLPTFYLTSPNFFASNFSETGNF